MVGMLRQPVVCMSGKEEYFRLEETVCAEEAGKSEECLGNKMLPWLMRSEPNCQGFEMRVQVTKV